MTASNRFSRIRLSVLKMFNLNTLFKKVRVVVSGGGERENRHEITAADVTESLLREENGARAEYSQMSSL